MCVFTVRVSCVCVCVPPQVAIANTVTGVLNAFATFFTVNMPVYTPCTTINAAFVATKDDVCCDVFSALGYHTLGWLVFALLSAGLGIPVSILGFKRFTNHIWVRGRGVWLCVCVFVRLRVCVSVSASLFACSSQYPLCFVCECVCMCLSRSLSPCVCPPSPQGKEFFEGRNVKYDKNVAKTAKAEAEAEAARAEEEARALALANSKKSKRKARLTGTSVAASASDASLAGVTSPSAVAPSVATPSKALTRKGSKASVVPQDDEV